MGSDRIWLDSASTTPLAPEVAEAMAPWLSAGAGANPSSLHAEGRAARRALEEARDSVADVFGVLPAQVHFTGSATEANNLAIRGRLMALPRSRRPHRVVGSAIEHECTIQSLRWLEHEGIAQVEWVHAGADGRIDVEAARRAFEEPPALASLMHVNNETGIVQPIEEWAAIARAANTDVTLHCDAVQAIAKLPLDTSLADLWVISGHKMHGPAGIGALIRRRAVPLMPLILGGPQEGGLRAGTESVAGAVGLAVALRVARSGIERSAAHLRSLAEQFLTSLQEESVEFTARGEPDLRAPGMLSLHFPAIEATDLIIAADLEGVALSAGSACHSGTPSPSHVLLAMGLSEEETRHTVRVAFHRDQTAAQAEMAARRIAQVLARVS